MDRIEFYRPRDRGFEREISRRLEYWAELRARK
jgi:putative ATPase